MTRKHIRPQSSTACQGESDRTEALGVQVQACLFVPVQLFNFTYCPPHLRVPLVVGAGVVWISALSVMHGDRASEEVDE